jgi:solute carrier family 25 (mitochondrial carnitine/acylcarnitine transporter), member 20/29
MSKHKDSSLHGALAGHGSSTEEAAIGFMSGVVFGLVSPVVGHPFDTIKTKMQAETAHQSSSVTKTVQHVWRHQGIRGFYRGFVPPLIGSMAFRGLSFSAYSGTYAACEQIAILKEPIPYTGGIRMSVLIAAMVASFARATIESPMDFIKLRYQIGKTAMHSSSNPLIQIRHLYQGYIPTLLRTMGLLGSFFIMVEYSLLYIPEVINAPLIGPFFKGGVCATAAWVFAFPFETVKSVIQADQTGKYSSMKDATWKVMREIHRERGIKGLYRGFGPGASRSFVANGTSMVVYSWFQDAIRKET